MMMKMWSLEACVHVHVHVLYLMLVIKGVEIYTRISPVMKMRLSIFLHNS